MSRQLLTLVLLLLAAGANAQETPSRTSADVPQSTHAPALTLEHAWAIAAERNPMLAATRAAVEASAAREASASLPPDPRVEIAAMNLSLPELSDDMPGAMAPSISAMQMIPIAGQLGLNGRIAEQSTQMADAEAAETWWMLRGRVAEAFYEIHEADAALEAMRETLAWLQQFEQVAVTRYTVGGGSQSDVLRAGVEVARMQADIARMEAMRTSAVARLNALLGRSATTPVDTVVLPALPDSTPDVPTLQAWAGADRPLLERGRIALEQARTRETLARREIWPDLSIGVQYGQRTADMGTERMGSVMLGFTVPIFAAQRQLRMRSEARAMQQMAEAELTDLGVQVAARIVELDAALDRARSLVRLYRTEVLPQAEANVTSALASYRVGSVDFMTLVDAQMGLNQYRRELAALVAEYGRTIADLEMTVGRVLPPATALMVEEP
ncbi:MAG TPA: TolC family protein [Longimicrobiales bacterium]|nr:TolC family protein [Longimicrobiales bacterium]